MKTRVSLIFWHKIDKVNKQGLAPISCRVTVRGQRTEISAHIRVARADWGGAHRRVLGKSDEAKRHNSYLLQMQNEIEDLVADLDRQGKPVTAQGIARLLKRGNTPSKSVLGLYEAFITERAKLVGVEIASGTQRGATTCYNRLKDFLEVHRLTALLAEEFTHNMADKVVYWLMSEKGLKRNSANKIVRRLSQVLRWGIRREYLERNPLDMYKCKGQATAEIKHLTEAELAHLTHLALPKDYLIRARDCFVLQCWTGLAYADLVALNVAASAEYHNDGRGNLRRVLHITRAKSTMQKGYECVIPLLSEAERILALYGERMPVPTNQAYNRFLKEVGTLAGIDLAKMTTHVGRKTAGTLMLNRGVPLAAVSKFLGHANTLITQKIYAKLLDKTVIDAFGAVFTDAPTPIPPAPVVYELPAPKLKPLPLRPARRIEVAEAIVIEPAPTNNSWRRPPPVTSYGAKKGGEAA